MTTITFVNESFRSKPALVYIWHPERSMPEQTYAKCGQTIIVTKTGTLKLAISKAIKPKGTDGKEMSKKRKYVLCDNEIYLQIELLINIKHLCYINMI